MTIIIITLLAKYVVAFFYGEFNFNNDDKNTNTIKIEQLNQQPFSFLKKFKL